MVYSHSGSGQVVVLLHGFLEEKSMWEDIQLVLQKKYSVLSIDLLGHGKTENLGYIHTMLDQSSAVKSVLEKEGVDSCIIIGHSMGGYVALNFAETFNKVLKGLVLFHSTALPDSAEKLIDRERIIGLVQRNKNLYVRAAIPSLFPPKSVEQHKPRIEALIATASSFSSQGIIANIRGMMQRKNQVELLKNGAFPKLVIHGTEDPVISNKDIENQVQGAVNLKFVPLKNKGHMGQIEAQAETQKIIADFCASVL